MRVCVCFCICRTRRRDRGGDFDGQDHARSDYDFIIRTTWFDDQQQQLLLFITTSSRAGADDVEQSQGPGFPMFSNWS